MLQDVQSSEEYFEKLKTSSCKLLCLDKLVKKFGAEKKKILIFS